VDSESWGEIPELTDLGFSTSAGGFEAMCPGGEEAGLGRLDDLLRPGSAIYDKPSKHAPGKQAFSSNLSAWLALGCLSPRKVYWRVKAAEREFGGNAHFNQVLLGLLWRDYYRFMFKKHGIAFFSDPDFERDMLADKDSDSLEMEKWKSGSTGHALVDQYMTQLNTIGYMPHAGRLAVATFLVYVLKQDWTKGAAYFEEKLVDYAPASNWGNWASVAARGLKVNTKSAFDLEKQIKILDVDMADVA
jgi:deoxyribodipyrimidine photo-lyase